MGRAPNENSYLDAQHCKCELSIVQALALEVLSLLQSLHDAQKKSKKPSSLDVPSGLEHCILHLGKSSIGGPNFKIPRSLAFISKDEVSPVPFHSPSSPPPPEQALPQTTTSYPSPCNQPSESNKPSLNLTPERRIPRKYPTFRRGQAYLLDLECPP